MKPIKIANIDLFEHDSQEKILGEARRHPIGIVMIVISALVITAVLALMVGVVEKNQDQFLDGVGLSQSIDLTSIVGVALFVVVLLVVIGSAMAIYVYRKNYIVLTDQKIVFIHTFSIFRRKISQLSIGDVQDLSVAQSTVLSRIFRYGTIFVETAGEQKNIMMKYIADPFEATKTITDAHEENMKLYGN